MGVKVARLTGAALRTGGASAGSYLTEAVVANPPFTMACWCRPSSQSANVVLMEIGTNASSNHRTQLFLNSSTLSVSGVVRGTTSATTNGPSVEREPGALIHAAFVLHSATSKYAYDNGDRGPQDTVSKTPSGMNRTVFGNAALAASSNATDIWIPTIWNVALSSAEIMNLAQGADPRGIRPDAIVACLSAPSLDTLDLVTGKRWTSLGSAGIGPLRYPARIKFAQRPPGRKLFVPTEVAALTVSPSSVVSSQVFGTSRLDVNIQATALANTQTFGTASTALDGAIQATAFSNAQAYGTARIDRSIQMLALVNAQSFGSGTGVDRDDRNVQLTSLVNDQSFGTAAVNRTISTTGFANAQTYGASLVRADPRVLPTGFAISHSFGTPTITGGAPAEQTRIPTQLRVVETRLSVR